jgi:hypothetical protein
MVISIGNSIDILLTDLPSYTASPEVVTGFMKCL